MVEGFGGRIGAVFCQVVGGKAEEVHNLSEGFEVVSLNEVFGMGRHGHHKDGSSLLLHFLLRLPLGRLRRLGDLPSGGGGRRGRLRGGEDA